MADDELRALSDRALLEELLPYTGCKAPEKLSAAVWSHFDGVAALTSASLRELRAVKGMDRTSARFFRLVGEIGGRIVSGGEARDAVDSPARAAALLAPRLRGLENEILCCLCLDKLRRPVDCVLLSEGGATQTPQSRFEVLRAARSSGSRAVILAHNHPTGELTPSVEDVTLTGALAKALRDAGITLLDHIIFTRDGYVSLAESPLLPPDPLREPYLGG